MKTTELNRMKWLSLMGALLLLILLPRINASAQNLTAIITDTLDQQTAVQQVYIDYEYSFLSNEGKGTVGYQTSHTKSYDLYLQDLSSEAMSGFFLGGIDSLLIEADVRSGAVAQGIVSVILTNGQFFECKLNYWPLNTLSQYICPEINPDKVVGIKRRIEGWTDVSGQKKRFTAMLESIRAIRIIHENAKAADDSEARKAQIKALLSKKRQLEKLLREIEFELDSLRGE